MDNKKKSITSPIRKRTFLVIGISFLIFVLALQFFFASEESKMTEEYEAIVTSTLKRHTEIEAEYLSYEIERIEKVLTLTFRTLDSTKEDPEKILVERNKGNPNYMVHYLNKQQLKNEDLHFLEGDSTDRIKEQVFAGKLAISSVFLSEDKKEPMISIVVPHEKKGEIVGALYTYVDLVKLLSPRENMTVYKDMVNLIITKDGHTFFNLTTGKKGTDFFKQLTESDISKKAVNSIREMLQNDEIDSYMFKYGNQKQYVATTNVKYNDWHILSFVNESDSLTNTTAIFGRMFRISMFAIIFTVILACVVLIELFYSQNKLEKEQQRNLILSKRFQTIFEQGAVMTVLSDATTLEILDINQAACDFFHRKKENIIGKRINEFQIVDIKNITEQWKNLTTDSIILTPYTYQFTDGRKVYLDGFSSLIEIDEQIFIYSVIIDSTERETYKEALYLEKEFFKATLHSIGDGVIITDKAGKVISINRATEELLGWKKQEVENILFHSRFILRNEQTKTHLTDVIDHVLTTREVLVMNKHLEIFTKDSQLIPISASFAPILATDGEIGGAVMTFHDIRLEKEYQEQIEFMSYNDSLTRLYNRRYLEERITQLETDSKQSVSVVMADVNGLKITNDIFGHHVGDLLLRTAARLMEKHAIKGSIIGRWGGDEFVILMPGTPVEYAEEIVMNIKESKVNLEGTNLPLSLSLGCALASGDPGSISDALQEAEKRMYRQKLLNSKSYRNAVISALLATLYEKSSETEEHSKRLESYCHSVGKKMHLSSTRMDELELLALLHDIGKVGIDPSILNKPGKLTEEEWEEMKRHPEIGYRIAKETPELAGVAELILSHHERWDGKGYPRNLKGKEIPIACRVLSLVDSYDAMISDRVYRKAMSKEEALAEIKRNKGTQFDPKIVEVFLETLAEEDEQINE